MPTGNVLAPSQKQCFRDFGFLFGSHVSEASRGRAREGHRQKLQGQRHVFMGRPFLRDVSRITVRGSCKRHSCTITLSALCLLRETSEQVPMMRLLSYNKPEWLLGRTWTVATAADKFQHLCLPRPYFVPAVLGALADGASMPASRTAMGARSSCESAFNAFFVHTHAHTRVRVHLLWEHLGFCELFANARYVRLPSWAPWRASSRQTRRADAGVRAFQRRSAL